MSATSTLSPPPGTRRLTTEDVAALFGYAQTSTVLRRVREDGLPAVRFNRRYYFNEADVRAWMAERGLIETATAPDGTESTRTSGTMPYVAVLMTKGPGQLVGQKETGVWGAYSWHKTHDAAVKASRSAHMTQYETVIVPAVPTAVNGKASAADFADHPSAEAIAALIEGKAAPKARTKAPAKATRPAKTKAEGTIVIAAGTDAAEVKRAKRRARRLARRAAETPDVKAARLQARRERRAARKAVAAK